MWRNAGQGGAEQTLSRSLSTESSFALWANLCSCNINTKIICNGTDKVLEYVHTCTRQHCWGGRRWEGTGQMVMSQPYISASSGHLQASYTLMASLSFILKISDYILINFLFIWNLPGEFCWSLGTSNCLIQSLPGQRYHFFSFVIQLFP